MILENAKVTLKIIPTILNIFTLN